MSDRPLQIKGLDDMGVTRKLFSMGTIGLVDYRSDKERIARNTKKTYKAINRSSRGDRVEDTQTMRVLRTVLLFLIGAVIITVVLPPLGAVLLLAGLVTGIVMLVRYVQRRRRGDDVVTLNKQTDLLDAQARLYEAQQRQRQQQPYGENI